MSTYAERLREAASSGDILDLVRFAAEEGRDEAVEQRTTNLRARLITGGAFIHDVPEQVPAVWGAGDEVLWSQGEPLMITGPPGVGKTTLAGQVVGGRLGLLDDVLGYPVAPTSSRVLYLAMDRPAQIARALGRLLRDHPREALDDRLVVWPGPLLDDLARNPAVLLEHAHAAGADTVVVDSLKDAALKLSDDEVGSAVNRALQTCVRDGVEVLTLHHQRKNSATGRPNTLDAVYGSAWLTAGMGSVVLLWGAAGDPIVELAHLKQPAAEVGPLKVEHDHGAGRSTISRGFDYLESLRFRPRSAGELAMLVHGTDKPTDTQTAKVRRKLDALVTAGHAVKVDDGPTKGGAGAGGKGARYAASATDATTDGLLPGGVDR